MKYIVLVCTSDTTNLFHSIDIKMSCFTEGQNPQPIPSINACASLTGTFRCPSNRVIIIGSASYGVAKICDSRTYSSDDCIANAMSIVICTTDSAQCEIFSRKNDYQNVTINTMMMFILNTIVFQYQRRMEKKESPGYPRQFQIIATIVECFRSINVPSNKAVRLWLTDRYIGSTPEDCTQDHVYVVDNGTITSLPSEINIRQSQATTVPDYATHGIASSIRIFQLCQGNQLNAPCGNEIATFQYIEYQCTPTKGEIVSPNTSCPLDGPKVPTEINRRGRFQSYNYPTLKKVNCTYRLKTHADSIMNIYSLDISLNDYLPICRVNKIRFIEDGETGSADWTRRRLALCSDNYADYLHVTSQCVPSKSVGGATNITTYDICYISDSISNINRVNYYHYPFQNITNFTVT
ncbi:unnamed protein product [Rotaria magnacalcarata]